MKPKYHIGEIVYLISDSDQLPRIITGIMFRPHGFCYYISCATEETRHYEIEVSHEKTYVLSNEVNAG